jgi:hypothetical protein
MTSVNEWTECDGDAMTAAEGGEGGPNTIAAGFGELEALRRSLPFGGRVRSEWFLVAAVTTGLLVALLAVAPLR